jgi:hypothetical protein
MTTIVWDEIAFRDGLGPRLNVRVVSAVGGSEALDERAIVRVDLLSINRWG